MTRVYSLNLYWKSLDASSMGSQSAADQNLSELARRLKSLECDFVALQEAASYPMIEAKIDPDQPFRQNMKKLEGTAGTETVVTLYHKDYVLEETKTVQIGSGNRVCLLAFFSNKLCFINVHAPHYQNGKSGATQTMEAIQSAIPESNSLYGKLKTYDLIIAGDFNCPDTVANLKATGSWLRRNLALNGNHTVPTVRLTGSSTYTKTVDFILSTRPVDSIELFSVPSSDHQAISAVVGLPSQIRSLALPNVRNPYQNTGGLPPVDDDDENPLMEELKKTYKISTLQHCDQKGSCSRSVRALYDQARRDGMRIADDTYFRMLRNYLDDLKNSTDKKDRSDWTVRRLSLKQLYIDSYLVGKILRFYNYPTNYLRNIYAIPLHRSVVNYLDQIDRLKAQYPTYYEGKDAAEVLELDGDIQKAQEAREAVERIGISPSISVTVVPRVLRVFDY